jgi:hypothetical protein
MTQSEKVTAVCKILKNRFPNLTVEDTVNLAFKIIEAIES